jgi:stalled ribosome rescue protein Dom34
MKTTNQLGIWMDHSVAYLMELTTKPFEIQTILCELPLPEKNEKPLKNDTALSSRNKSILYKFYHQIGAVMLNYKKIVLFGPSDAKINFFDFLSENECFLKLKIEIKYTEKMNENQQDGFIREYFK